MENKKLIFDKKFVRKKYELGGFMDSLDSFSKELERQEAKASDSKAEIVEKTLFTAQEKLDFDYLPVIKSNPQLLQILVPYIQEFKHLNLYKLGWRCQFGTSKQWAGLCSVVEHKEVQKSFNRNIFLSIDYVKYDSAWAEGNMIDTIMHEIAHAIVFEIFYFTKNSLSLNMIDPKHKATDGHGEIWGSVCSTISGEKACSTFYENLKREDAFMNYKYTCPNCGNEKYGNTPNFASRCSKCGKSIICEKNYD